MRVRRELDRVRRRDAGRRVGRSRLGAPLRALAVSLALGIAAGCAGGAPSAAPGPIVVVGSWTGDELTALKGVMSRFEKRTGETVDYVETRDLHGLLDERSRAQDPPDIAGVDGPAHLVELAKAGRLRPLSGAIDVGEYKSAVAPTFIELGTVDGRLVGAFIKSTAKGLIWYDPEVFQGAPPGTWDELQRAATATASGDTRPWCVGLASGASSGWPGTDWIENLLIRQAGPDVYDRWVAGAVPWTSREVRRAFEAYGQVVDDATVHGGRQAALRTEFTAAGDGLFSQPPGCVFLQQGSFIVPFLAGSSRKPGVDFDFFPFPELDPAFDGSLIGAGDLVALMSDKPAARALMSFLLSEEAQAAWVATGAALSVDSHVTAYPTDVGTRMAKVLTTAEAFRFDGSDSMPAAMQSAFLRGILDFTADQRRLPEILAGLDTVRASAYGH